MVAIRQLQRLHSTSFLVRCGLLILLATWADLTTGRADAFFDDPLAGCAIQDDALSQSQINTVVRSAFSSVHRGFSADEILLDDELQAAFLAACREELPSVEDRRFNWALLNLRKAGKLSDIPTTQFRPPPRDEFRAMAEIAARTVQDRYDATIDRILADPNWRADFDAAAKILDPAAELYQVRKAALQLRKTRRLRPELVTRIANWGRAVETFAMAGLADDLAKAPAKPGIYLFRDATGYLYIGEADNVRKRLETHLTGSDRALLSAYLQQATTDAISVEIHTFEDGCPIEKLSVRRAYESELIRSRNPRFNVRP